MTRRPVAQEVRFVVDYTEVPVELQALIVEQAAARSHAPDLSPSRRPDLRGRLTGSPKVRPAPATGA